MNDTNDLKSRFSVRIVVCDHYLTRPIPGLDYIYSEFRGADIKQVPVLRVFGSTSDGKKACLHIHGVFPYFYLPCPTSNPEPQFLYQIAASLDKALNIALKQATSMNQHVYKISLVKGLPFYGFHDKDHLYLKVFLYNPGLIKQAVELCSNGAISGQVLQPHESHLNFTLQFFIDFNLFGMSNIDLQSVIFRNHEFNQNNDDLNSPDNLDIKRESACFYEADCIASHIINRQRVGRGDGIENPGLEEVWNQEIERRKNLNVSMASKSLTQGRLKAEETESHYKYENVFHNIISQSSEPVEAKMKTGDTVHYPAESLEGSQLINATYINSYDHEPTNPSISLTREGFQNQISSSYDADNTVVDEDVALNCSFSLQYSQVLLDSEDMELVDMLQHLDEKPVEEDSIMGTQIMNESEEDLDDDEYAYIFNENTTTDNKCSEDNRKNSNSWDDTFWEGADIPQLDGAYDDDDHKVKVRKRKRRPFQLGLSRPKTKQKDNCVPTNNISENNFGEDMENEINVSRDINEDISSNHLRRKDQSQSILIDFEDQIEGNIGMDKDGKELCTTDNHNASSFNGQYFEPVAGPSRLPDTALNSTVYSSSDSETSPGAKYNGIESFYDTSKIFDTTLEDVTIESKHDSDTPEQKDCHISEKEMYPIIDSSNSSVKNSVGKNSVFTILTPNVRPPTKTDVIASLDKYSIPRVRNPEPYFSTPKDVGDKVEIGHMVLKVKSKLSRDQKPFGAVLNVTSIEEWRHLLFLQSNDLADESTKTGDLNTLLASNRKCILTSVKHPPTRKEVISWLERRDTFETSGIHEKEYKTVDNVNSSQAIGLNETEMDKSITLETTEGNKAELDSTMQVSMQPDGSYLCFGGSENQNISVSTPVLERDYLTVMIVEVQTNVRGDLKPDPAIDRIEAVFLKASFERPADERRAITEVLLLGDKEDLKLFDRCLFQCEISYYKNEIELLQRLIDFVKLYDPDIMCGYEIEMSSWGYVLERSQVLGVEMIREMSRITDKNRQKRWRNDDSELQGRIIGRITFNVWRLFRHELALSSYSFENCMYEILKERVPTYSCIQLAEWWSHESAMFRWIPVEHYLTRLSGTLRMLEKLDIINRTSELARLFGLQWWEVLSRGSQFRVESLMLRAARPLNLVALSPTVSQRAAMRAPEYLPLIFEPESRFFTDPVIVLDFQSLYPSVMIAYNYCFSTCVGRVQNVDGHAPYEFGAWKLRISKAKLQALGRNGLIHWSPAGVGFVKPSVRRGVLPALLRRILAARQAVEKGMKLQTDESVKKTMHSRQLGLKLIANVTYGYTAANFSGRMPCVEVGDSVVAKGRETLERAIKLVSNGGWNAKVVYGDTDSMFVQVPGGSRAEAFSIGQQIADAVTADNPSPVALKLEKVYQPCILQTKKRYVGYMYESVEQERPVYEAKGIETVRRDGCPAGVQLLQGALCELFSSGDVSRVKRYVTARLERLVNGLPLELMFTREYHGASGYRPGASAPPNEIAKRLLCRDKRAAPRNGERVRWVVVAGAPGEALVRLARSPHELLRDPGLTPHLSYYVARVLLPPLHRCLSLLGVDVFKWWRDLACKRDVVSERAVGGGIARYMHRGRCALCGDRGWRAVCPTCAARPDKTAATLGARRARLEHLLQHCLRICNACCGHQQYLKCDNTECPALWRRVSAQQKVEQLEDVISNLPANCCDKNLNF